MADAAPGMIGLLGGASLAVLPTPIELEVEVCPACGRIETKFKIEFVLSNAFLGTYPCCGEERVVVFDRTKWSLEFVEKRMAEHKRQMHALECRLIEEVIDEFQSLPARAPKQSGWLFETLPGHDETKAGGRVQ